MLGMIGAEMFSINKNTWIAGVVARVESLPLAVLGDFVRRRMGESTRQVDGLFESMLAEAFERML
jgi:hypothetical protein